MPRTRPRRTGPFPIRPDTTFSGWSRSRTAVRAWVTGPIVVSRIGPCRTAAGSVCQGGLAHWYGEMRPRHKEVIGAAKVFERQGLESNLSLRAAYMIGRDIVASPSTVIFAASGFTFPQDTASRICAPEAEPSYSIAVVRYTQ